MKYLVNKKDIYSFNSSIVLSVTNSNKVGLNERKYFFCSSEFLNDLYSSKIAIDSKAPLKAFVFFLISSNFDEIVLTKSFSYDIKNNNKLYYFRYN